MVIVKASHIPDNIPWKSKLILCRLRQISTILTLALDRGIFMRWITLRQPRNWKSFPVQRRRDVSFEKMQECAF